MKKVTTLILAAAALALQACAIEGSHRLTPTGIQISRTIGLGTGSTYQSNINTGRTSYTRPYQEHQEHHYHNYNAPQHVPYPVVREHRQQATVIGPQYYRMERPVHGPVKNYMDAPIVAPNCRGDSVIIPRSWD